MKAAYVVKVMPERPGAALIRTTISVATMQRLCGSSDIRAANYCPLDDYVIRIAQAVRDPIESAKMPCFSIGSNEVIRGQTILFGMNKNGGAASCPVTLDRLLAVIEWWPALPQVRLPGLGA